jgi:hypothetical protein
MIDLKIESTELSEHISNPSNMAYDPSFLQGIGAFNRLMSIIRGKAIERIQNIGPPSFRGGGPEESWLANWFSLLHLSWDDPITSASPQFRLEKPEDRERLFYLVTPSSGAAPAPGPAIAKVDLGEGVGLDMGALYQFFSNFNEYVNDPNKVGYDWSSDENCIGYNRFIYLLYGLLQFNGSTLEKRRAFYMAHFLETLAIPKGIREGCAFTKHIMEAFHSIGLFMSALVNGQKAAPTQEEFENFMFATFIPLSIALNAAYIFDFDADDEITDLVDANPIIWASPYSLVTSQPHPDWGCDETTYQERCAISDAIFPHEERPNALKRIRLEMGKPRSVDRRAAWQEELAIDRFIEESKRMEVKVNTKFTAMLEEERQRAAMKQLREVVESPKHPEVINRKAIALLDAISTTSSTTSSALGDGTASDATSEGSGGLLSPVSSSASKPPRKIPNILRRRPTNENKPGSSPHLFHFGDATEEIYNRPVITIRTKNGYKPYVVMKVVNELPDLLKKPRNKANFMGVSTNKFFDRSVSDMDQRYKNQLYFTTISFCEEIAAIPLMDNEARMEVMGRYYGTRREDEPLDNYYHNFRKDVWDSIAFYYAFYSYL